MARRGPSRNAKSKRQKTSVAVGRPIYSASNSFCYVLDLGSVPVWDYLDAQSVSNTLQACPGLFSTEFVDSVSLKAVDNFAVEHKLHLGRHCECDWMRRLDFSNNLDDRCKRAAPFTVDKKLPILQLAGGPKNLLAALLLTKKLVQPFEAAERSEDADFAPMLCPLVTPERPNLPTKAAITRAMNDISPGAGSRFFYKFKLNPRPYFIDYIEEHWSGMGETSCEYCDSLTDPEGRKRKKYADMTSRQVERVRANCTKKYRPLKAALEREMECVRYVRRPRRRSRRDLSNFDKYKGLVAGVTEGGVLCGLFLVSGFWPN